MNGHIYYVPLEAIAITAAQDIFEILPADDKALLLHWAHFSQHSDTDSEGLQVSIRRLTATVTSGSGGGTPNIRKRVSSSPTAGFTAKRNNTSRATTSGTNELLIAAGINVLSGWDWLPTPELRPMFVQGEALIFGLETAPVDSITADGFLVLEEIG